MQFVVRDLATQRIQSYTHKTKASQATKRNLRKFLDPEVNPKVIYTDRSLKFGKAFEDLRQIDPEDMEFKETMNNARKNWNCVWILQCRAHCERLQGPHP